jgi:hypothetical protein
MLDIREGDILVMNGKEYPILYCATWKDAVAGSTATFKRMCSETASTKRPPAVSGAVRGDPEELLSSIKLTPLDPLGRHYSMMVATLPRHPYEMRAAYVDGGDTFYEILVEYIRK